MLEMIINQINLVDINVNYKNTNKNVSGIKRKRNVFPNRLV
tara:strand:- start:329 stop:451 length:123 start_codon:yes stop_codon:yes gene_type:complete